MEIPLTMLSSGCKGRITRVRSGRGLINRLSDMGFVPNVEVRVIHSHHNNGNGGPLVVELKDSRIALGRDVAMKIMVKEIDS